MSDTRRWVHPINASEFGNALFVRCFPNIRSLKHLQQDRHFSCEFLKKHKFRKGSTNSTFNLKKKVEERAEKEELTLALTLIGDGDDTREQGVGDTCPTQDA